MDTFQSSGDALAGVKAHPLCSSYMETPSKYVVFYPDTYRIPSGTAVQKSGDVLADLSLLYRQLENFWQAQRLQVCKDA